MTRGEFLDRFEELAENTTVSLLKTATRMIDGGAVNLELCHGYSEVKAMLCAAMRHEVRQLRRPKGKATNVERNAMHF
ncbi:MAG: hypothetical protein NTW96_03685 [Planctomycetia bacterium]|nr:hypothetical protein [Planctomycetia bacterium]